MLQWHKWFANLALLASLAVISSAVADEPAEVVLPRVPPMSPGEALEAFEVADGFRIELVAAEPLVVDPVAMAFDERGRLYVVEMRDYSEQDKARLGRVRLLADEDGDGRFETSRVFADGLSWPTAVACYDGGVFIGNAPDILYCKDTDGDGVADERRVVFTGFGRGNVQGLINSFQWGLDQRIYGATSSAGGSVTRVVRSSPDPAHKPLELRGRDFAFDPKTLAIQAITGGGQHGLSFNRWGDRFVCHNSDHLQAIVFEERYLARNPYQSVVSARRSIAADGPQAAVFRASPVEAWRVARTAMRLSGQASGPVEGGGRAAGYFTSSTGITVYDGGLWNEEDGDGLVYVADVGSNLIHRKRMVPDGVTYRGERIDEASEFVRSTDIWFRPVQMTIGPEGALYVADMYREVIEHPLSLPPELKRQLDLTSGNDRGRIYRIVPADYRHSAPRTLASASTGALVGALDDANAWRRATASRLLYERQDPAAVELLRGQLSSSKSRAGRIATLYALDGAGGLTTESVSDGLNDSDPQVRRHALRLAEPMLDSSRELRDNVLSMVADSDLVVQFQLALTLGECDDARGTAALVEILTRHPENSDIVDAVLTSIRERAGGILQGLLVNRSSLSGPGADSLLPAIVTQIVRQRRDDDLAVLVAVLKSRDAAGGERMAALVRALSRLPASAFSGGESPQLVELAQLRATAAETLVRHARQVLARADAPQEARLAAVENLALGRFDEQRELLESLLSPQEPAAIHDAVLAACAEYDAPAVAELVLSHWEQFGPAERSQATELLLRRAVWANTLLQYLESEGAPLTTLEPAHVVRLENYPAPQVRELARTLRGRNVSEDRRKVFESYRDVALAGGDVARGKLVFEKNCASCHDLTGGGQAVGPHLAAMVSRGAESVLFNILAPSSEVEPRYLEYVVMTADGQVLSGLIAGETSTAVTLRGADGKTATVLRVDIEAMQNTGKSLMPEGFEKAIDPRAMADLLSYLQEAARGVGAASRAAP